MSEHTKEKLILIDSDQYHGTYIEDEHGETICDLYVIDRIFDKPIQQNNAEENARRIVACVNACAGMSNEELDAIYTGKSIGVGLFSNAQLMFKYRNKLKILLDASKHIQSILRHPTQSVTILDCAKLDDAIENAESE